MIPQQMKLPLRGVEPIARPIPTMEEKRNPKPTAVQTHRIVGRAWNYIDAFVNYGSWAKGWEVTSIRFKISRTNVLIIIKANKGSEKKIAFSGGANTKEAILTLRENIRRHDLKWKDDVGYQPKKKKSK